jgi:hypothetical protein
MTITTTTFALLLALLGGAQNVFAFDPRAYKQRVARCPGINRTTNTTLELDLRTYALFSLQF